MNALKTPSTFVSRLRKSGLLSKEQLNETIVAVGENEDRLVRYLLEQELLTAFQIRQIRAGSSRLTLGNYVAVDFIGKGGNGIVFKAQHRHMADRFVAIKTLDARNLHHGREAAARFQREIENLSRLNHPNIVQAFDVLKVRQHWYLILEYIDGKDLEQVVKERGPLPIHEALDYVIQAARGLAYAHQHGIVHRDVKPTNLLLTNDNKTIKLSDLGLSRSFRNSGSELTLKGVAIGTPEFMAPEQAEDASSAGPLCDVYSLGATLFHLLTGKIHIRGSTFVYKLQQLLMQDPQPILDVAPDIPPKLATIVDRLRERDPHERPQSAAEVIELLEPFVTQTKKQPRRKPSAAEMAKLVFAIVKNDRSVSDICKQYELSEAEFLADAGRLLQDVEKALGWKQTAENAQKQIQALYSKIGALSMEIETLKR